MDTTIGGYSGENVVFTRSSLVYPGKLIFPIQAWNRNMRTRLIFSFEGPFTSSNSLFTLYINIINPRSASYNLSSSDTITIYFLYK